MFVLTIKIFVENQYFGTNIITSTVLTEFDWRLFYDSSVCHTIGLPLTDNNGIIQLTDVLLCYVRYIMKPVAFENNKLQILILKSVSKSIEGYFIKDIFD